MSNIANINKKKILSFPLEVYGNGGGNRILRRMYAGKEADIISLAASERSYNCEIMGMIPEIIVSYIPNFLHYFRRWYLRTIIDLIAINVFGFITKFRLQKVIKNFDFEILHIIDHGPFSGALCTKKNLKSKTVWVSFHDYFSTTKGNFKSTKKLWNLADRRLMISEELGEEYCRLFGKKEFEIITDGISINNITQPKVNFSLKKEYTIYFGGLLHIDYYPLFESFSNALDEFLDINKELKVDFILRGTQKLSFLNERKFKVEYRPFTTNDDQLRAELNEADLLYLPIKFTKPLFYKYSLSTKMVGYTGAGGCIFYHGPNDSAASNLLKKYQAAICCNTLNSVDIIYNLLDFFDNAEQISNNAKKLLKDKFIYEDLYAQFWQFPK